MRKFTLFMMSLFLMLGTAMAQNYSLTETCISSGELNAKTAPTLIAIKNLSRTNNYYFVGNTGATPYSAADFSDAAVFVWQPVQEGVAGSYYLMKLDGTYMQATSPKDFGTVDNAAVFTTTNPTTAGTGSAYFNGDGDSQGYIDDEALLVRFVNTAGTWINVQNGDNGTPTYNQGTGGWTIHHVYAVEEPAAEYDNIADIAEDVESTIKGTVIATYSKGFLVQDETGMVLVYLNAAHEYVAGDVVTVNGVVTTYGGLLQFPKTSVVEKTGESATVEYPTATVMDGAALDAFLTAPVIQYVEYTGTLTINGSYYNVAVEGATTAMGSIQYPNTGLVTASTGDVVKVTGYTIGVSSNKYVNTMAVAVEVVEEAPDVEIPEYNVTEALAAYVEGSPAQVTVTGYIVGSVNSNVTNAAFGADATTNTNMLISDNPYTTDVTECLVIQLPSGDLRNKLNIVDNPANYRAEVVVTGSLEKYCGAAGVKYLTHGELTGNVAPEPEPETPFEVVAVTPSEAVTELSTITVEFSEEIAGEQELMAMETIYVGSRTNACNFTVDGKVLTITLWTPITAAGEYGLYIPESVGITRKSNGETVTMNGEISFTVEEAVVEPEPAAGIEVGKHYRIKSTSNGDYLTIGDTNENRYGHVHGAALDEANDNQVFTFIAVEGQENTYYVQSVAGKYFSYEGTGAGWNVNGTDDATKAHALTFEAAEGELQYLIKCYNASKSDYKYFKYEYVNASGKYHPFNDADLDKAEVWTLEEVAVVEPEPEEKDDNTIALIESANELLAIEGVGYPATTPREALKAAIAAAEEKPDTEAGTALQAAIDAYYATTDVVLPEGDKVYSLKMVAKNGNKFYLNYTGSDIAMVARTTDEELPNSAKFAAEDNGDGTISLKTIDGKYLVYHSKYAGLNWLQGGGDTDGLQETKDDMTNITFAKMVNGNKVEATGNEQIFGMLTWYGKRGYDTGKSEDCYGYMVLKTDGSDYDGASVPFWNDGYSSAFIVEETEYIVEPLNVVAVTPAEDEVVNSLREITIEFDAEIAVKELSGTERISIDYGWGLLIGTTATVEGKLLKLVADTEITYNGTYPLTIPAGVVTRVSDGVAYEGGTFTFTVEKAAVVVEPLTVVAVTPAEAVETLETITIEFSDNVDVPATASGKFTIADADGNNVATLYAWDAAVDGKVVTLTLTEAITTAGEYTFSFAEGLVARQGDQATCAYTCTITVTGVVGIDSIYGEAGESVIYDITGRKIEKITEGGIYIVNGKKVLVK
ncbi:MAG: Ig-like domain-containing protein [Bacteroidaceae bacterium]|nr:Ig-like domain-containing protein [Bacteroidaceae bacterium]